MNPESVSPTVVRIIIAAIGVVVLIVIYLFGRPRKPQSGRRVVPRNRDTPRVEPVVGADAPDPDALATADRDPPRQGELDVELQRELDRLGATMAADRTGEAPVAAPPPLGSPPEPTAGRRSVELPVDRIVTLFVTAREGHTFDGSDIVVAAEKAGLRFGAMHIFHRLADGRPGGGPIFSMANMMKPGYFDMPRIAELATPGVTFFVTLPGPVPALDAWDTMLAAARRIAELLDGVLLDEDRNALGRQRIAGLREELRAWDRQHEGEPVRLPPRG